MTNTIAILNGPKLALLGKCDIKVYGEKTLQDLELILKKEACLLNITLSFFQSNHEGSLIDKIENWFNGKEISALVFNPGAYSHTSLALYDIIKGSKIPTIEVHISNIYKRELFRRNSVIASACLGTIAGLGFSSYVFALRYLCYFLKNLK